MTTFLESDYFGKTGLVWLERENCYDNKTTCFQKGLQGCSTFVRFRNWFNLGVRPISLQLLCWVISLLPKRMHWRYLHLIVWLHLHCRIAYDCPIDIINLYWVVFSSPLCLKSKIGSFSHSVIQPMRWRRDLASEEVKTKTKKNIVSGKI